MPYLSPGITFSFNFDGYFIVSPKISIGFVENGSFYNITYGKSWSSDTSAYPHYFIEFQSGAISTQLKYGKQNLFVGGGVGVTIPSAKTNHNPSFRITIFSGFMYFLNATFLLSDPFQSEIGGQVVLPIPLFKIRSLGG